MNNKTPLSFYTKCVDKLVTIGKLVNKIYAKEDAPSFQTKSGCQMYMPFIYENIIEIKINIFVS